MGIVPKPISDKIAFYNARVAPFAENAEAIGTTPEAVADLQAKLDAAKTALIEQHEAQNAARSATLRLKLAAEALGTAGANIIAQVRTQAQTTDNPAVYTLALIPPIADRSPMGEPGTPFDFNFTLDGIGMLRLKWKCKNPRGSSGTVYQVYRKVGMTGEYQFLATTGTKSFTDATVPTGVPMLMYKIQPVRSTKIGTAAQFSVNFGTGWSRVPANFFGTREKAVARAA